MQKLSSMRRIYSHFHDSFGFSCIDRIFIPFLLNTKGRLKKKSKRKGSNIDFPFPPKRTTKERNVRQLFTIDAREFCRVHRGEKRFHMTKRCPISFVSNGTRKHRGWPKFFSWPCCPFRLATVKQVRIVNPGWVIAAFRSKLWNCSFSQENVKFFTGKFFRLHRFAVPWKIVPFCGCRPPTAFCYICIE